MIVYAEQSSAHYYDLEGNPQHTVEYADKKRKGQYRASTLKDAKKNGWLCSVTTILQVLAKEGLTNWRIEQSILAALTLPRLSGESEDSFAKRVVKDMGQQTRKAADRGAMIHAALERYLTKKPFRIPLELEPMFLEAMEWADENVLEVFAAERVLVNPEEGYAGTVDLVARIKGIGVAICDFKTKSGSMGFYDEWALQLEAYRQAWNKLYEPKAEHLLSVVISSEEPKPCETKLWDEDRDYWSVFLAARDIWNFQKNYHPNKQTKEIE